MKTELSTFEVNTNNHHYSHSWPHKARIEVFSRSYFHQPIGLYTTHSSSLRSRETCLLSLYPGGREKELIFLESSLWAGAVLKHIKLTQLISPSCELSICHLILKMAAQRSYCFKGISKLIPGDQISIQTPHLTDCTASGLSSMVHTGQVLSSTLPAFPVLSPSNTSSTEHGNERAFLLHLKVFSHFPLHTEPNLRSFLWPTGGVAWPTPGQVHLGPHSPFTYQM